jgi:hypothetical protein
MAKYRVEGLEGDKFKVHLTYRQAQGGFKTVTSGVLHRPTVKPVLRLAAGGMKIIRDSRKAEQVRLHEPTSNEVK